MKQMKRCLAWLLSVLMIFSMTGGLLVAFAAVPQLVMTADKTVPMTGDEITITVSGRDIYGTETATVNVIFDPEYLEYANVRCLSDELDTAGMKSGTDDTVAYGLAYMDYATEDTDFFEITFKVLKEGDTQISATAVYWTGIDAPSNTSLTISAHPCEHENTTFYPEEPATCNSVGYTEGEYCADCDTWLSGHEEIPMLPHGKVVSCPEEPATCTKHGYTAGQFCEDCGEWISGHEVIPAHPDANDDGLCDICGLNVGGTYLVIAPDADRMMVGKEVTITVSGVNMIGAEVGNVFFEFDPEYLEYVSASCIAPCLGDAGLQIDSDHVISGAFMYWSYAREDTDLFELTFRVLKEGETEIIPTVNEWTGTETPAVVPLTVSCYQCRHENAVILPEEPATCTAVGYTEGEYCGDCDTWLSGHEEIPMLPHANIVVYPEQAPTCTAVGYTEGERCEDCGTWLSGHEVIPTHPDADGDGFCDICGLDKTAPYLVIVPDPDPPIVGQEVTISVSGVNMVGTQTGTIAFEFDPTYLEFVYAESMDNGFAGEVGLKLDFVDTASFGFMYMSSAKEDTELCQLTFKVLKTGDTEIIPIVDSWTGIGAPAVSPLTLSIPNPYREYTMAEGETLSIETDSAPFARVSFVPEVTGYYSLESFSDGDPGCSLNGGASGLDYITYDGDSGKFGKNFKLTAYLTAGETYCFDCYPAGMGSSTYDITLRYEGEEMPLYIYKVNEEGNAVIVGTTFAPSGDLVVPEELEGYPVTGISDAAFLDCEELKSVTLPASVTFIGDHALGYVYDEEATSYVPLDDFTICGVKDSEAERYAAANGFTFAEIVLCAHTETEIRNALAATCTTDGYTGDTYCVACDALLASGTAIPATGHSLEHVVVPSTCKVAGVEYDVCTNCGEAFNNTVLELGGHTTEKVPGKAATCTQAGLTDGAKCSVCGETLTEQTEIPATGHQFGEWTVLKNATFLAVGTEERSCKLCGLKETKEIPVLVGTKETVDVDSGMSVIYTDGTYDSDIKLEVSELFDGNAYQVIQAQKGKFRYQLFDITTTADGEKVQPNGTVLIKLPVPEGFSGEKLVVYYVSNTGTLEKMNSVVKDGYLYFEAEHFSSYAIVDESAERPAYMMGDLDGDGKITASDARHVLRIAAKLEVASVREDDLLQMADTNGDKTITAVDARKILRVAAKLDTF